MALQEGTKAPAFTLQNVDGKEISLSDFSGKKVVLYFYPKDNTSGCSKEACSFRDFYKEILKTGAVVIGVSKDSIASHEKFRDKYGLPFYLVSDKDHHVAEDYGVWGEKKMYGKVSVGMKRTTFVISEEGVILRVFEKIKTETHGQEVLDYLRGI